MVLVDLPGGLILSWWLRGGVRWSLLGSTVGLVGLWWGQQVRGGTRRTQASPIVSRIHGR